MRKLESLWRTIILISKVIWTKEYPTEEGDYWSYGGYVRGSNPPKLIHVRVKRVGNGTLVFVGNGAFLYDTEWVGYWTKAEIPELPIDKI